MLSELQVLEEERRKLLSNLHTLDNRILRLKQSTQTNESEDQPTNATNKAKESTLNSTDDWQCLCGNILAGNRQRCGKCRRWRGGKRTKPKRSGQSTDGNQENVQNVPSTSTSTSKRKRGRKVSGKIASSVSLVDEQAAASLLLLCKQEVCKV